MQITNPFLTVMKPETCKTLYHCSIIGELVGVVGLIAICIDDYITMKGGGIGLYSWITRIMIKCCFIAQSVIYFTQYKKAKALEESEDK